MRAPQVVYGRKDLINGRQIQYTPTRERAYLLKVQRTNAEAGLFSRKGNEQRQAVAAANHGSIGINQALSPLIEQRTGRLRIMQRTPRSLQNTLTNVLRQPLHGGCQQIDFHGKERQVALAAIRATYPTGEIVLLTPLHLTKKAVHPTLKSMVCLNGLFQSRHAASFC